MRFPWLLGFGMLALVACSANEQESPVVQDSRVPVDIEEMDIRFLFAEPLVLRASQDEALLSGDSTRIQVQSLAYDGKKQAPSAFDLPPWSLPKTIADSVRDGRSCSPLKDPGVFLPVETESPFQCDLVIDVAGRPIVWMTGLGRPFRDVPFLQSALLVLEEGRYHVFSYVSPFPESDATVQWLHDTFKERHPNMSTLQWPNKSFMVLTDEVRRALSQQIEPPSAEVQGVMEQLRSLAFSVGPSRARMDR